MRSILLLMLMLMPLISQASVHSHDFYVIEKKLVVEYLKKNAVVRRDFLAENSIASAYCSNSDHDRKMGHKGFECSLAKTVSDKYSLKAVVLPEYFEVRLSTLATDPTQSWTILLDTTGVTSEVVLINGKRPDDTMSFESIDTSNGGDYLVVFYHQMVK